MFTNNVLIGQRLSLKVCDKEYATEEYVNWLNDPQINQFLEVRFERQTLKTILDYVYEMKDSEYQILFAIIESSHNKHIGNIQLTFNWNHKYCGFGYFIGDKAYWGQEIAVEAIQLATKWAFETTDIVRMEGGVYSRNIFSLKTMIKAGFHKEAVLKDRLVWKNDIMDDHILVCLFKTDFEQNNKNQ